MQGTPTPQVPAPGSPLLAPPHAPAQPPQPAPGKAGRIGCCCCCTILVVIAIVVGSILGNVDPPKVSVRWLKLKDIATNNTAARITMDMTLNLKNPNGWPVGVTIRNLSAEVYSINRQSSGKGGQRGEVYLGKAELPKVLEVNPDANVDFLLTVTANLQGTTALVAGPRWLGDCGPLPTGREKTTRLLIRVLNLVVEAVVPVQVSDVEVEADAPCDQYTTLASLAADEPEPRARATSGRRQAAVGAFGDVSSPEPEHALAGQGPHAMRRERREHLSTKLQP